MVKVFASGSPAGDMVITSAPFEDPEEGWQVLHFPVPLTAEGARIDEVWRAHGMRGTGSNNIVLEGVFVPDEADRPQAAPAVTTTRPGTSSSPWRCR